MLSLLEDGYLDAEDEEDTVRTHYAFFIVVHYQMICSFYYIFNKRLIFCLDLPLCSGPARNLVHYKFSIL